MNPIASMSTAELAAFAERARADHAAFCARRVRIDMTRGKPCPEQLDLSSALLTLPGNGDYFQADGGDTRNYYGSLQGLPEARALFAGIMGAPPERVLIGNNASLSLMHDCIVFALLKGVPGGARPWSADQPVAFLCPSPGYDRHFALCEEYGIRMIPVAMTGAGPDMDEVERLVLDPAVRGMWCVPKYSNPTGESYAPETVARIARMRTGAPDFRLFWDNAYAVHHLTDEAVEIANILELCAQAGHPDRAFVFASTSKMTFAGAGLGLFASSERNMAWFTARISKRTIGPDKLNQLRHVRFLKDEHGIRRLMAAHRALLVAKFRALDEVFLQRLGNAGVASWSKPRGGYFVSVDTIDGCARRVVELAAEAGIAMVPAGQTYPYRSDPRDRNLRIAPSFPSVQEVTSGAEGIALSILVAATERLLYERSSST
jgi:DNA-binding transcriptional MocR family regulator